MAKRGNGNNGPVRAIRTQADMDKAVPIGRRGKVGQAKSLPCGDCAFYGG
jgi:hypothetical protein